MVPSSEAQARSISNWFALPGGARRLIAENFNSDVSGIMRDPSQLPIDSSEGDISPSNQSKARSDDLDHPGWLTEVVSKPKKLLDSAISSGKDLAKQGLVAAADFLFSDTDEIAEDPLEGVPGITFYGCTARISGTICLASLELKTRYQFRLTFKMNALHWTQRFIESSSCITHRAENLWRLTGDFGYGRKLKVEIVTPPDSGFQASAIVFTQEGDTLVIEHP